MKNKKGISIGRIILYFLFLSLIALFVYTLFITFKAMKKKSPGSTETQVNSSLRFAYNNQFQYSVVDNFEGSYATFSNNSLIGSGSSNPFTATILDAGGVNWRGSIIRDDNVLNYSSTFGGNVLQAYTTDIINNNYYENGYFDLYNFMFSYIKCDVLIDDFNFIISGSNSTVCRIFYVTDSLVNSNGSILDFFRSDDLTPNVHYNFRNDILGSSLATDTRILYFGFGIYNRAGYNFIGDKYITNPHTDYQALYSTSFDVKITFDVYNRDSSYQEGYDAGYQAGVDSITDSVTKDYDNIVKQNNSLANQVIDLESRINQQSLIINQLNNQLQNSQNNFKGLFFTFADIPFKTVSNALGFEFWGVNLFRFFVGIITALGILWLIKRLYK